MPTSSSPFETLLEFQGPSYQLSTHMPAGTPPSTPRCAYLTLADDLPYLCLSCDESDEAQACTGEARAGHRHEAYVAIAAKPAWREFVIRCANGDRRNNWNNAQASAGRPSVGHETIMGYLSRVGKAIRKPVNHRQ